MVEKFIVKVAVEHIVYHLDKLYDYVVPEDLRRNINVGCRVLVPFGAGNKKRQGIVLQTDFSSDTDKLKQVFALLDTTPILNDEMLNLDKYIKLKYENNLNLGVSDTKLSNLPCSFCKLKKLGTMLCMFHASENTWKR